MLIDPLFSLTSQYFLGLLLIAHALHKVMGFTAFIGSIHAYRLLPEPLIFSVAISLIAAEFTVGTALVGLPISKLISFAAMVLFSLYFAVIAISLVNGRTAIDCGCSFSSRQSSLSVWHLARNATLIFLAAVTLLPIVPRDMVWVDTLNIIMGVLFFAVVYLCVDALLLNRPYFLQEDT